MPVNDWFTFTRHWDAMLNIHVFTRNAITIISNFPRLFTFWHIWTYCLGAITVNQNWCPLKSFSNLKTKNVRNFGILISVAWIILQHDGTTKPLYTICYLQSQLILKPIPLVAHFSFGILTHQVEMALFHVLCVALLPLLSQGNSYKFWVFCAFSIRICSS